MVEPPAPDPDFLAIPVGERLSPPIGMPADAAGAAIRVRLPVSRQPRDTAYPHAAG